MLEVGERGAWIRYQDQIVTTIVQATDDVKSRYVAIDVAVQPEERVVLRMHVRVHALLTEVDVLTSRVDAVIANPSDRSVL
jgi:hypothetical protein